MKTYFIRTLYALLIIFIINNKDKYFEIQENIHLDIIGGQCNPDVTDNAICVGVDPNCPNIIGFGCDPVSDKPVCSSEYHAGWHCALLADQVKTCECILWDHWDYRCYDYQ